MQLKSQLKIVNFSPIFVDRFNYKIGDVFRELMGCTRPGYIARTDFSNGTRAKGKCNIL